MTMRWVLAGGLLAFILAVLGYSLCWRLFLKREPVLPMPPRYPIAPWSGSEVSLALLIYVAVPSVVITMLHSFRVLPAADMAKLDDDIAFRLNLVRALVAPLVIAAILAVLWFGSRTRPKRLGLRLWRWQSSLYLAGVCYVVVTPIVLGINLIATSINESIKGQAVEHPLMKLAQSDPRPATLALVVLIAVVLASITEELIFRGIMMPWLGRRWWGGWAAVAGAIAMGLAALPETGAPLAFALVAGLFGIALTFPHMGEQWTRRSIIGTALLFAMFHYKVWPSPVPLFFLGIALGWLAHRSRGLLAPILLHALFNATSTLMLFQPLLSSMPE